VSAQVFVRSLGASRQAATRTHDEFHSFPTSFFHARAGDDADAGMEVLKGLRSKLYDLFDTLEVRLKQDRKRAEDDLEAHFHCVETVLHKTALPSISPRVKYSLLRFCDVSALLAALKQPAGDSESSRGKLEVWQDLKVMSFARASAAVLSLTIVSTQMRLMLTVLSRQLFLERAVEGVAGRDAYPALGIEAQEFFLSLVERGFATVGIEAMVGVVRRSAEKSVGDVALSRALSRKELRDVFARLRDQTVPNVKRGDWDSLGTRDVRSDETRPIGWESALLPSDATVRELFRARFVSSGEDAAAKDEARGEASGSAGGKNTKDEFSSSLELIIRMAQEVRAVSMSRVFVDALEDAMNRAWEVFIAEVEDDLFDESEPESYETVVPVAKLVPAISNLAAQLLGRPERVFSEVASCPKVQDLTREMW